VLHEVGDVVAQVLRGLVGRGHVGVVLDAEGGLDGDAVEAEPDGIALDWFFVGGRGSSTMRAVV